MIVMDLESDEVTKVNLKTGEQREAHPRWPQRFARHHPEIAAADEQGRNLLKRAPKRRMELAAYIAKDLFERHAKSVDDFIRYRSPEADRDVGFPEKLAQREKGARKPTGGASIDPNVSDMEWLIAETTRLSVAKHGKSVPNAQAIMLLLRRALIYIKNLGDRRGAALSDTVLETVIAPAMSAFLRPVKKVATQDVPVACNSDVLGELKRLADTLNGQDAAAKRAAAELLHGNKYVEFCKADLPDDLDAKVKALRPHRPYLPPSDVAAANVAPWQASGKRQLQ
jgi:hypothetical protein